MLAELLVKRRLDDMRKHAQRASQKADRNDLGCYLVLKLLLEGVCMCVCVCVLGNRPTYPFFYPSLQNISSLLEIIWIGCQIDLLPASIYKYLEFPAIPKTLPQIFNEE